MFQNVFIIGATGKVGSTLVSQIFKKGDTDKTKHKNPTRIVGLAYKGNDTYFALYNPTGIEHDEAIDLATGEADCGIYASLDEMRALSGDLQEKLVFVDVTAAKEEMLGFHLNVMTGSGRSDGIVTANKNPLVMCDSETFEKLTGEVRRYGYRCTVMAGAEAVEKMRDLRDLNDRPVRIEGCFSGTLGYIATEIQKGSKLSDAVAEAKAKCYTEPHPRDDLSGADVAKKLLILARTAGFELDFNDIKIEPFIPHDYLNESNPEAFLNSLSKLDSEYSRKASAAARGRKALRYVAVFDASSGEPELSVGLREVPLDSPLGMLRGTSNKITVITGTYTEDRPYIVEAPGAGLEVTAQNIRRDLLYQLDGRCVNNNGTA